MGGAQPDATRSAAPRPMRELARGVGGILFMAGGLAWAATFVRLASEHPQWGGGAFEWLAPTAALLGGGALATLGGRWGPLRSPLAAGGAVLASIGLVGVLPSIGIGGFLAVAIAAPLLGAGLTVYAATRRVGGLLCGVSAAFLLTRPWMLGPVGDPAGWARDAIEVGLAMAVGGSWLLVGMSCVRDLRPETGRGLR